MLVKLAPGVWSMKDLCFNKWLRDWLFHAECVLFSVVKENIFTNMIRALWLGHR